MNRRLGLMAGAVLVIVLGLIFLLQEKGGSSLPAGSEAFAIRSAAEVGKIRVRSIQKEGKNTQLKLERDGSSWILNDDEAALAPKVERLLNALEKQRIRQTITDAGQERVADLFNTGRLEVSLWDTTGKLMRAFDIGVQTQDNKGTVMRLKGDATAYIVAVPGVSGYLNSYFVTDPANWRENVILNAHFDQIKSVTIDYLNENETVQVTREVEGWSLSQKENLQGEANVDAYISQFNGKVYGETFAAENFPTMTDSLKKRSPDIRLSITENDDQVQVLELYIRPENRNNYFGFVQGSPELRTVQTFVIDKFLSKPVEW